MYSHVFFAVSAIFIGILGIFGKPKGGLLHKKYGRVYFYVYIMICLTGFLMLTIKFKSILLGLTIFNIYLVANGFLAFRNFKFKKVLQRLMIVVLLFDALFLVAYSTIQESLEWKIIFYFYIGLIFFVILRDSSTLIFDNGTKQLPETHHMEKMLLSFIALIGGLAIQLLTPFINEKYNWTMWIISYAIGLPLIFLWTNLRKPKVI